MRAWRLSWSSGKMHKTPVSKGAWEPHPSIHPSTTPKHTSSPFLPLLSLPCPSRGEQRGSFVTGIIYLFLAQMAHHWGRPVSAPPLRGVRAGRRESQSTAFTPVHSALPQPRPLVHHLTSKLVQGLPPPPHIKRPSPPISLTHRHTDTGSVQTTK